MIWATDWLIWYLSLGGLTLNTPQFRTLHAVPNLLMECYKKRSRQQEVVIVHA